MLKNKISYFNKYCRSITKERQPVNKLLTIGSITLIAIASVWFVFNILHQPPYGDTVEYWELSQTLQVDSWRTIFYPVILHILSHVTSSYPWVPLYFLQTIVSLCTAYYFVCTLNKGYFPGDQQPSRKSALVLTAALASLPLVNHFGLTTLTDSLSTSFFILSLLGIIRIFVLSPSKSSKSDLTITSISTLFTVLLRPERAYVITLVLLIILVRSVASKHFKHLAISMVVMLPLITGVCINSLTQTADHGRPKLSVKFVLFDRLVRGNLEHIYFETPKELQNTISLEAAREWDADPNRFVIFSSLLSSPEGSEIARSVITTSIQQRWWPTLVSIAGDVVEYIFAPFTYLKETLLNTADTTAWNNSRMSYHHPLLSKIYIYYFVVLQILMIVLAPSWVRHILRESKIRYIAIYFAIAVLLLAIMYGLRTGADFNIRYGLPIYFLILGFMIWATYAYYFTARTQLKQAKER